MYRGLAVSTSNCWTSFRRVTAWTGDYVRMFSEKAGVWGASSFDGKGLRAQGDPMEMLPEPPGKRGSGHVVHVDRAGRVWASQV